MSIHSFTLLFILTGFSLFSCAQTKPVTVETNQVITGADRTQVYIPLLKGKKVAVFANQTSRIGNTHLVDSLLTLGINIVKIFSPEHGFRGQADAGEKLNNSTDSKTGLPIISLYGKHVKPTPEEINDVDVLVFDIQDVGVRFYTYISSLEYFMEACIENHKPLMILDRPNPNAFYIDGPVLEKRFRSFIGRQPVPIVYGMTIGEYALMLPGEKWLSEKANAIHAYNINTNPTADTPFHVTVIKCKQYNHQTKYALPVQPSPNLREMQSVYWYPSTGFFEGTLLSEGRGTEKPFQIFGHPSYPKHLYAFTPKPNEGAKKSKCFYEKCYGWNISGTVASVLQSVDNKIQLKWLIDAYQLFPGKDSFFLQDNFFHKIAGNDVLMQQIKDGKTETDIRKSWEPGLVAFKEMRKKYLLYDDF